MVVAPACLAGAPADESEEAAQGTVLLCGMRVVRDLSGGFEETQALFAGPAHQHVAVRVTARAPAEEPGWIGEILKLTVRDAAGEVVAQADPPSPGNHARPPPPDRDVAPFWAKAFETYSIDVTIHRAGILG